jgi:hypothetical protein
LVENGSQFAEIVQLAVVGELLPQAITFGL